MMWCMVVKVVNVYVCKYIACSMYVYIYIYIYIAQLRDGLMQGRVEECQVVRKQLAVEV